MTKTLPELTPEQTVAAMKRAVARTGVRVVVTPATAASKPKPRRAARKAG